MQPKPSAELLTDQYWDWPHRLYQAASCPPPVLPVVFGGGPAGSHDKIHITAAREESIS